MKVNRQQLRDILSALRPGLAKREFIEQSCHFIFFDDTLATFNGDVLITHPYKSEDNFSVKGEEFFRLIDGINDTEININLKNKLVITSKSTSAMLAILTEESNTLPPIIKDLQKQMTGWKDLPKDFTEGISLCAFSASPDKTRAARACVLIKGDKCSSIDTARGSLFKMESSIDDSLLIMAPWATDLSKFPVVKYCTSDKGKWGHFRTKEDITFSCKLIDGDFPVYFEDMFEDIAKEPHFELPKELKTIADSVFMLASDVIDKTGKALDIVIEDGEIIVKASNDLGEIEKNLRCSYKGEPIKITINATFISQILDKATSFAHKDRKNHFVSGTFQHLLSQATYRKD